MEFFKNNKLLPVILIALAITILWLRAYILTLCMNFNGVIEKVRYSEPKHNPYITVNGKEYDLMYSSWITSYKDTLAIGDSVIKRKGVQDLILIKARK